MNVGFPEAISTLLTLQRLNFVPQVEAWTEAENVAYVSHLIYAVGRASNLQIKDIERTLARALVKSFNKHFVSDISHYTRKAINDVEPGLWQKFGRVEKERPGIIPPL
ncbi:MAG: hypothetical protein HW390_2371 [Candidatus Brocadiaceae bacterium]|nr:hypothetical protein [Candidatus Brocadiaceae bacterium]